LSATEDHGWTAEAIVARMRTVTGSARDADLARRIGVTRDQVAKWKTRDSRPYAECLHLSRQLGVSLDWLLTGEGVPGSAVPGTLRDAAVADERAAGQAPGGAGPEVFGGPAGIEDGGEVQYASLTAGALERELSDHWRLLRRMCADDPDYADLLGFLVWLLDWWEAVGPDDHAWLLGQLRRHIPDWITPPAPPAADRRG
jgi:transcriptional regulator with XRE-family HTH domain